MNSLTYYGFLLCTILNSRAVCRIESESKEDISAKKDIADLHLSLVQSSAKASWWSGPLHKLANKPDTSRPVARQ